MICEPWINKGTGVIEWFGTEPVAPPCEGWLLYADHEREKLKELGVQSEVSFGSGINGYNVFVVTKRDVLPSHILYSSSDLIDYDMEAYRSDSESGRLLKRAEFLKDVCQKEGVEWLPKEKCCHKTWGECGLCLGFLPSECGCSCHKKTMWLCHGCGEDIPFDEKHDCKGGIECVKCGSRDCDNDPCHKKPEDENHAPECPERYGKRCNDTDNCPCRCHPDKYYTRAEIDEKITKAKRCMWDEEREWREALLDAIGAKVAYWNDEAQQLRKRFT